MPYQSYQFGSAPFLLGLTVPRHWGLDSRESDAATALMQRAAARGFDFLLAPHTLAAVYAPAVAAPCALSDRHRQMPEARDAIEAEDRRDLIWLQRPLMAAEGGIVVSSTEGALDRQRAAFLKDRIATTRKAGEGGRARCILLEVGVEGIGLGDDALDFAASDEDDMLESFVISLGRRLGGRHLGGRHAAPCAAAGTADPEKLHQFLLLLRETGCDGASLVLPDPLRDMETFGDYALRRIVAA